MKHKLVFSIFAVVLAAATLACGAVDNLVDRAVEEAEDAAIEQVETQTGEELPDFDSLQATADAALEELDEVEGIEDVEGLPGYIDSGASGFPTLEGANLLLEDENTLSYSVTGVAIADAVTFYRDSFTSQGMTEQELTTVIQDTVASLVFQGDPSGKDVALQIVDLGDGTLTITITRDIY